MTERACKSCGKPMLLVKNAATGKWLPLDARAVVYQVDEDGLARKVDGHYVSHFNTCPQAGQHSKKGRG